MVETKNSSVRYVLRSLEEIILKDIWKNMHICSKVIRRDNLKRHMKKHAYLSSGDPEQICKSILVDVINDIPETSMYKRKVNDLNSDEMDELHNLTSVSTSDPIKRPNEKSKIN